MLFPEEIFKIILKKHKISFISKQLNALIKHKIENEHIINDFYKYERDKLKVIVYLHHRTISYVYHFWFLDDINGYEKINRF